MKTMILIFSLGLLYSCQQVGKMGKLEFYSLLLKADPKLLSNTDKTISCNDYRPGCVAAMAFMHQGLQFIVIEFDSLKHAENMSKRINAYQLDQFVLDDMKNEPALEKLFQENILKEYQAFKP